MNITIKSIEEMKQTKGVFRDDFMGIPSLKREDGCHFQMVGTMETFCGNTFEVIEEEDGDFLIRIDDATWWIPPFAIKEEQNAPLNKDN